MGGAYLLNGTAEGREHALRVLEQKLQQLFLHVFQGHRLRLAVKYQKWPDAGARLAFAMYITAVLYKWVELARRSLREGEGGVSAKYSNKYTTVTCGTDFCVHHAHLKSNEYPVRTENVISYF